MYLPTYYYHVVRSCAMHVDNRNMSEAGFTNDVAAKAYAQTIHDGLNFTHVVEKFTIGPEKIIFTIAP